MSKYEFVFDQTKVIGAHTLYRIRALRDFANVKKGDLGGFIEKEKNLSHEGDCWVYGNDLYGLIPCVWGNARVTGNARAYSGAKIYDNALLAGSVTVSSGAKVYDNAKLRENAKVHHNAEIYGNAHIFGRARVCNDVRIGGNTQITGNADIDSNGCWVHVEPLGITGFKQTDGSIFIQLNRYGNLYENFMDTLPTYYKPPIKAKRVKLTIDYIKQQLVDCEAGETA